MKKLLITTITLLLSFILTAESTLAYTVKEGDNLTSIAAEHNLTIQEIAEINPQIIDLDLIYIGDIINTNSTKGTSPTDEAIASEYEIYNGQTVTIDEPSKIVSSIDLDTLLESETTVKTEQRISSLEISLAPKPVQTNNDGQAQKTVSAPEPVTYTDAEIDLLARLVRAEAQIEPFDGKVAVACVVLNRVESSAFPDTIKEVIYQRRQFQPVSNGQINKPADEESIAAVKAALSEQRDLAKDSLFFYNPAIATSRWLDSRTTTLVIGQHEFKK